MSDDITKKPTMNHNQNPKESDKTCWHLHIYHFEVCVFVEVVYPPELMREVSPSIKVKSR